MVDIFVFQHSVGLTISEGKVCSEEYLPTMIAVVGVKIDKNLTQGIGTV